MNWRAIERDRSYVLGKLREGVFDAVEIVTRVAETEFFDCLLREGNLAALAATYPTPRQREDVPLWVYLSSELSLRINASHGFKSFPYVLPCSGLRDAFGPDQVRKARDPHGRGARDHWEGFNRKNAYARHTVCDPDYLRKMARDTAPERLQAWYNHSVAQYYRTLGAYDPDGIFIADGTYLFVPDNPRYERSDVLMFDEHNHPVGKEESERLSADERRRLHWERCYRKVGLLHTTWDKDFYLYTGVKVMRGRDAECPALRGLVDGFVKALGKGVMKVLIHDRGFIDGPGISHYKREHEIDTVFPLKKNMHCFDEAWRLADFSPEPWGEYTPPEPHSEAAPRVRPEYICRREQKRQATIRKKKETQAGKASAAPGPRLVKTYAKAVKDLRVWDTCRVPIHVVAMRDEYDDGHESRWVLATTMDFSDPIELRRYYQLRPAIEERIRQTKCFWDLTKFRATKFSLVVNQIVFVLMAYSLVQIYLLKTGRKDLARRVRQRLFQELMEQEEQHAVYCDHRVAFLPPLEYQEILLSLEEHARRKLLGRTRQLRAQRSQPPAKPWRQ
jgi:hypothetical protein